MADRYAALASALQKNLGKSIRAEDLDDFTDFFVDPIGIESLSGNGNQLIFGRRGSGKTILTGALAKQIENGALGHRIAAFRYSAEIFRSSAQFPQPHPTASQEALVYFNYFLTLLVRDLYTLAEKRLFDNSKWSDSFTRRGNEIWGKRNALLDVLAEFEEVARFGVSSVVPADFRQRTVYSNTDTRSGSAAASLGIGTAGSPVDLEAKANLRRSRQRTFQSSAEVQSHQRFSPGHIKQLIVRIVELLDLDYIVVIIDEWMTLSECQAEFAQKIRTTLFGEKRISVKIAADQFQGRLNNGAKGDKLRGIEINADMFVATDLDRPFRDPVNGPALFTEALYRRLLKFEPALEEYFGKSPLKNPAFFIETLFTSDRAFQELCQSANGLCRDFYLVFRLCCKQLRNGYDRDHKIDLSTVRHAILENYQSTFEKVLESLDSRVVLFEVILPHLRSVESRFFLVPSTYGGGQNPVIRDLLAKRFIHEIPGGELHESVRTDYSCFALEYGMFVDMMNALEYQTGIGIDDRPPQDVRSITSVNAASYELDLSPLEADLGAMVSCAECSNQFLETERHYVKLGVCPFCLEAPIPKEEQE